jgi:cell wall-associated NlpC family hydrolase
MGEKLAEIQKKNIEKEVEIYKALSLQDNKFTKYIPYIGLKHDWNTINCLTIIEKIYKEKLGITFDDVWKRAGRVDGTSNLDRKWFIKYGLDSVMIELQNWQKIPLTKLKEYDILVFVKKERPWHFGMYIDANKFIHVEENSFVTISELSQEYRDILYNSEGCRHERMVGEI